MFGLSMTEMLFLGVLALIVIGPKQLPEMARHLGRFLNELKRATDGITNEIRNQARVDFDLNSKRLRDNEQPVQAPEPEAMTYDPHAEEQLSFPAAGGTDEVADSGANSSNEHNKTDDPEKPS